MTFNQSHSSRSRPSSDFQPQPKLPAGYLQRGYFDDKGNLLPQVIQEWAKAVADGLSNSKPIMTTSQLRGAFFSEVRRLEKKLNVTKDFDALRPELLKLSVYAADRKKKKKIPILFEEFINANLRWASRGEKDFREGFVNHFECVVGYYPEVRGI